MTADGAQGGVYRRGKSDQNQAQTDADYNQTRFGAQCRLFPYR